MTSPSDARFAAQMRQLEEASRPLTKEEQRERERLRWLQRANPGVLLPALHARLIANARRAQTIEEAEALRANPIAPQDPIHNPDSTVIARRAIASRQANRHLAADPNAYVDKPYTSLPPGPPRYPGAPEAEMIDAPWGRSTRW